MSQNLKERKEISKVTFFFKTLHYIHVKAIIFKECSIWELQLEAILVVFIVQDKTSIENGKMQQKKNQFVQFGVTVTVFLFLLYVLLWFITERKPGDCDQDIQKKKEALDQKLDMLSRERAMHRCEKREVARQF